MCPNKQDKHWGKQVSRYPNLSQEGEQKATLSPEEIAELGISVEEYEQDQQARQSLALQKPSSESQLVSSQSTGRPSAHAKFEISPRDIEDDRFARETLKQEQAPATAGYQCLPLSSSRAGPSKGTTLSVNSPGLLAALDKRLSHRSTPRIRIDKDPFGVLDSCGNKPSRTSTTDQMEEVQRPRRNVRHEAQAGQESVVSPIEDLPPSYEEVSVSWYQVVILPVSQAPPGSPYVYSHLKHHDGGPKEEILHLLRDAIAYLDVDMELVQGLEDRGGYCFPMHSSLKPPFQTCGWQNMVEVRRLNEEHNDLWETIIPEGFGESRLVKQAKTRAIGRLRDSGAATGQAGPSATGDGANNDGLSMPAKKDQNVKVTMDHGIKFRSDGLADIKLEVGQNVTVSEEEVHPDDS